MSLPPPGVAGGGPKSTTSPRASIALGKPSEPDPLPIPMGTVPRVHRTTLVGIQDAFRPWWSGQRTLNHLSVLYEARCLSYPRVQDEAFHHRTAPEACEWVQQATDVFREQGWPLPRVNGWTPDPELFDDRKVGTHTGIHPVFLPKDARRGEPVPAVLAALETLTDEQALLYRAVVLGFVRRYQDPVIRRVRLETCLLNRAARTVAQALRAGQHALTRPDLPSDPGVHGANAATRTAGHADDAWGRAARRRL